jgi:4-methylaminobutanoate oxidase (formaldehyde-forming)
VRARKETGPLPRRLLQVRCLEPAPLMFHAEVVRRDGRAVGYIRAASYGHTLGGAVGLAMVEGHGEPITDSWLDGGEWTVEINGEIYPAAASLRPMYDPDNSRIRS